jgi:uncharacterized protein
MVQAGGPPRFEWDAAKNRVNFQKHGVSFEEAQTVFSDDRALLIEEPVHDVNEERFILLGVSALARHLVVCHCYRKAGDVIRIISARKANSVEREVYADRWSR